MSHSTYQYHHIRNMQSRFKHKVAPYPSRRYLLPNLPRQTFFFLALACLALVFRHRISLLPPLKPNLISSESSHAVIPRSSNAHLFSHGTVQVDKVIWYEGDTTLHPDRNYNPNNVQHTTQSTSPPTEMRPVEAENIDAAAAVENASQEKQNEEKKEDKQDESTGEEGKDSTKQQEQAEKQVEQKQEEDSTKKQEQVEEQVQKQEEKDENKPSTKQSNQDEGDKHKDVQEAVKKEKSNDSSAELTTVARELPLREVLNFTPKTAINFMHFHKTGGVSFKTSLHKFYAEKYKRNGEPVVIRDACYSRSGVNLDDASTPTFLQWRCDWEPIKEMNEQDRNKHDFVFGHQFWGDGAGNLLNQRDLRSFTILRHPFDRKVSFYYHFFVRELGRKEEDVSFEEIQDFLLHDKLTVKADLGRDLGPNYMAGRLLSNGTEGFVGNSSYSHYEIPQKKKYEVAEKAKSLLRGYIFVGLQSESNAAKCMLRKVVETFNDVNGVDNEGVEQIDKEAAILNTGSYSLSAKNIWMKLSDKDKVIFDRKERVDLLIYEEGERLFRRHAKLFGCSDRIVDPKYKL